MGRDGSGILRQSLFCRGVAVRENYIGGIPIELGWTVLLCMNVCQNQNSDYKDALNSPFPPSNPHSPPHADSHPCPGRTTDKAMESLKMPSAHFADRAEMKTVVFPFSSLVSKVCMSLVQGEVWAGLKGTGGGAGEGQT